MRYIPHSPKDIEAMLSRIGVQSVDDLFEQIPKSAQFQSKLKLPEPLSEPELAEYLAAKSETKATRMSSFLGAGIYHHFIPSAVDALISRSEFFTAYTPYQPEISQGTLQAIFEFQTMVARILNMKTANASMYDGATALVEAALLARRVSRRQQIVASAGIHPEYIETLRTYLCSQDGNADQLVMAPLNEETGETDFEPLQQLMNDQTACVLVGYPNFYGIVERLDKIVPLAKERKVRVVTSTLDPFAFGVIKPPGDFGVDVATAEGQSVAVPPSYGGPGLGLFAVSDDKKLLRQMPGRLVGRTHDTGGKTGYVLTLATREQHIRREKATSNICTNHGLCALSAVINLSLLGKWGYATVATSCLAHGEYLKQQINAVPGFKIFYSGSTFNEFVVQCTTNSASEVLTHLESLGILGGVDLHRFLDSTDLFLVAVTELSKKQKLDDFVAALATLH